MSKGLMFRKNLPEDSGMLFVFGKEDELRFWGKNTYIPLDIAFIGKNKEIKDIQKISPLSEKTIGGKEKCLYALEVNEGFFNKNNIKIGDKVEIINNKYESIVVFLG
ncbi:MAG: DUF192 domain-containing protein, partial [Clostridia bacterium]|jgi:hypothetical protein